MEEVVKFLDFDFDFKVSGSGIGQVLFHTFPAFTEF